MGKHTRRRRPREMGGAPPGINPEMLAVAKANLTHVDPPTAVKPRRASSTPSSWSSALSRPPSPSPAGARRRRTRRRFKGRRRK